MADIVNQAQTRVMVDGQQADRELTALEKKARKFKDQMVAANNAGDTKAYDKAKKGLKEVDKEMRNVLRSSYDVNKVLSNLSAAGPKQLSQALRQLNKDLNSGKIARGSKEWDVLQGKIRLVRSEIAKLNSEQNISQSGWQKFTGGFNKYFTMIGSVAASITGLSFAFRKLAEDVAKMDDVYADVMKTTGMTRDQVVDLNEEFKKMDTRTSREQLNLLARDAGKLGLTSKQDILGFVEAGNQINVALGEDLGEGAIKNIGKITDVFKLSTKELDAMDLKGRMLAVGSAINELGQSSTASEPYLVNFTQRLGGVASQAGISVQNILGYASALDQSGQAVEMSATALQKFIMKLMGEPEKFAKMAGLEVSKFTDLLKNDTNAAIIQVLTALSQKGGFAQLIPVFKDMGLDGARAVGVISALATNIGKVTEAQSISNRAFTEGTSLTNEYNVKNNNLQASLEKARKEFKDAALDLGERLNPALLKSTKSIVYLVKILPSVLDFFNKYGKYILYIVTIGAAYVASVKLQTLWNTKLAAVLSLANIQMKLKNAWLVANRVAMLSYIAVTSLLTGNLTKATRAWQLLNVTMRSNPWGLALAAIAAVVGALVLFINRSTEAKKATDLLSDANNEAAKSISGERAEIKLLLSVGRNEKISKEERLKAIKRLNEISPEYLGNLNLENINTQSVTESVRKYTEELLKNARAKAIQNKVTQAQDDLIEKDIELEQLRKSRNERERRLQSNDFSSAQSAAGSSDIIRAQNERIAKLEDERKEIQKNIDTYSKFYTDLYGSSSIQKEQTEFQKLNDLLQKQADAYTRLSENKNNAVYNAFQRKQDEQHLQSLALQIESQKKLAEAEANRTGDNTGGSDTGGSDNSSGSEEKAAAQRKKVQDALRKLEIDNNNAVNKIKEDFRNGDIESESDFNARLLAQQDNYDKARIDKLNAVKKDITDASIREDIEKQISEIDQKALDREIKRQADIKKILLSADPAAAEKDAYENRLRELGLFGADREKITKDQLAALELLEKQHNERMSKIERPEVLMQLKQLNEDQSKAEQERSELRAKGLISEQQYQHELILLDIAYTAQKLQIEGLTEEQRIQLQRESYDKQRKLNEENAEIMGRLNKNKRLENLKDAQAGELALLDSLFDEELRKTEAYEQARLAIIQKYSLLEEEQDKEKRQRMIDVAQFALDSFLTLASSYSSYIQAANDAETAAITKKYDKQIKAAGKNSKQVAKLEEQRDKELAEVNRKNEERSFKIQIAMALASTAQSAINAYSSAAAIPVVGFTIAPIAAATAAAGLLQVAAIRKQHEAAMASYSSGGYTGPGGKYDIAGYVHRGEFVVTQETLANPEARQFVDVIDIAQRNNTVSSLKSNDFATAMEYRERVAFNPSINTATGESGSQQQNDYLIAVLNNISDVMALVENRLGEPPIVRNYVKGKYGMQEAMNLAEKMDKNVKR
ncbi:MAG: phage tail tape measure protein [Dysgonomonas sp.]